MRFQKVFRLIAGIMAVWIAAVCRSAAQEDRKAEGRWLPAVSSRTDFDSLGVKEIPITGERAVLTDEVIRKLARAGQDIKRVFNDKEQDIEWVYMRGQIYIVQSRPYLAGGPSMLTNPG